MKYIFSVLLICWYTCYAYSLKIDSPRGILNTIGWPVESIDIKTIDATIQSSSLESFFKYKGATLLSWLAHPTGTYESGRFWIYNTHVDIKINYSDGNYTNLRVIRSGNYFSNIEVVEDSDWWPPFAAIHLMKELADEWLLEDANSNSGVQSKIESFLRKRYDDFTGKDVSLFILNMSWNDR